MLRDTQSNFLDSLTVSKRGIVKVASSQVPGKTDIKKVLKAFENSPDVPKKVIVLFLQRAELDSNFKKVAKDFFECLNETRKTQDQLALVTAKSLRHAGVFKVAGRDVYEDLETGDFWKISEDKKHVMRLFKEDDKGISDKKASTEKTAEAYRDSAEFTGELEKVEDAVKIINTIVNQPRWKEWMTTTDENYNTKTVDLNKQFTDGLEAFEKLDQAIIKAG